MAPQQIPREAEDDQDDRDQEVIMAVDSARNGDFGCSYYVASSNTLYVMSDIRNGDTELLECCKRRSLPQCPC